jgi:hypothetical protein
MLREVKRAALRKCWLHIHFPLELVQREGAAPARSIDAAIVCGNIRPEWRITNYIWG